jgi:transposase
VELVEPLVERGVLVHPARVKAIASAKLKHDRVDSAILAQLLRANLLPEAWKADQATRDLRELLRLRVALGQQRTRCENQIHATLHRHGLRAPVSDLFGLHGRAWLAAVELRAAGRQVLDTDLRLIDRLDQEIYALDRQLRRRAQADPDARHLMNLPGIGPFSALVLKAEIGDIGRFRSKRSLYNYAGLVPVLRQSADRTRRGGITHAGSGTLRWVLSEAALTAARCSVGARAFRAALPAQASPCGAHLPGPEAARRGVCLVEARRLFRRTGFCGDVKGISASPLPHLVPRGRYWRWGRRRFDECTFCASSTNRSVTASLANAAVRLTGTAFS